MKYFDKKSDDYIEENGMRGAKRYAQEDIENYRKYRESLTPEEAAEIDAKLRKREKQGMLIWVGWGIIVTIMLIVCLTGNFS